MLCVPTLLSRHTVKSSCKQKLGSRPNWTAAHNTTKHMSSCPQPVMSPYLVQAGCQHAPTAVFAGFWEAVPSLSISVSAGRGSSSRLAVCSISSAACLSNSSRACTRSSSVGSTGWLCVSSVEGTLPGHCSASMKNSMNTFELSLDCTMQATIKCSSRVAISFRMQSLDQESFVIT